MKILNDKLVEEAINNYEKKSIIAEWAKNDPDVIENCRLDFKAGIKWSESQIANIAVEFAEWLKLEPQVYSYDTNKESVEKLFNDFIKQRND